MARDCEAVDVAAAVQGERVADLRGRERGREGGYLDQIVMVIKDTIG